MEALRAKTHGRAEAALISLAELAQRMGGGLALLDSDLSVIWTAVDTAATDAHELICRRACTDHCPVRQALNDRTAVEIPFEQEGSTMRRRIVATPWLGDPGSVLVQYVDSRNLSAQALRASVERYRALVENMAEGLCIIDVDEQFVMVNPAAERTFGVGPGQLEGQNLADFLPPEAIAQIQHETALRRTGATSVYEIAIRRADGEQRWLQLTASPRFDNSGTYLGAFSLFQDITERRQMEVALRESERNLRLLYDNSPVMLQSIDEAGLILNVNSKWLQELGYRRDDVIGRRIEEFLRPGSGSESQLAAVAAADGEPAALFASVLCSDGSAMEVEMSTVAMRDPQGRRISLSVVQDITQRRKAEEQLLRLYSAIEQAGECVVVTDVRGHVQYINSAFENLSGYTRAEALDADGVFTVPSMHTAAFLEAHGELVADRSWTGTVSARKRTGETLDVEATIAPVHDEQGDVTNYVCTYRDVSRERSLHTQLVQAQKMEAVGQMAGGVAHEFNNLLTAIIGNLSLAELEGAADPNYDQYLRDAAEAAQRSSDITKQLLLFSRKTAGTFEPVDLAKTARAAAKLARHSFPPGMELSLELDGDWPPIMGDATMLHQVVMNLVLNARDACPRGGRVRLRGGRVEIELGSPASLPPGRPGNFVVLEVSDTGEGMDPATLQRIFEPFFTTKPAGQGTGLGLAVAYSIIQQHGGWFTVDTAMGAGSTFRLYIPMTDKALHETHAAPPITHGKGETVLIVEDDALVLPVLRGTLRNHGYNVLTAANGPEALLLAERQRIELAVLDVQLPGMNGIELYEALLTVQPELRALFVSGNTSSEQLAASHGDTVALLSKPFRADALLRAVQGALAKDA